MSQKSDDSIEKFFRKAATQQDKTFMERDWQSMEKMLDQSGMSAESQHAGNFRTVIKVSALLLIISSLFFIGMEKGAGSDDAVELASAVTASGLQAVAKDETENPTTELYSSADDKTKTSIDGVNASEEEREQSFVNSNERAGAIQKQSLVAREKNRSKKSAGVISHNHENQEVTLAARQSSSKQTLASEQTSPSDQKSMAENSLSQFNPTVFKSSVTASQDVAGSVHPAKDGIALKNEAIVAEKAEDEIAIKDPLDSVITEEIVQEKSLEETIEEEKEKTATGFPRFSVTALFSPDFSTTSLTKYSKPSGVFGLMLGYKITPRFTVITGVTKALKKYEGYGDDYTPPPGYWQNKTNGVVPDEVEGNCGIVEVPLILQYDVVQRDRSRFFVSAGVSSYFMRSEHYSYTFNEPNPGAANSWTAKEPTQYLFKIGHLSAGYDRSLNKHFAIGIEPFLKVPFEGIGWTDINLYSTGAYLNLRYFFSTAPKL